jgi:diguanylate cyclase
MNIYVGIGMEPPLSLVIMDIDFFKKINDTYGHLAGDKVLAGVGRVLTEAIRETDFVARYGGEEFILLLPETSLPEATKLANKLRLRVQENCINYQNQTIVVTLSAGISDFAGDDEADMVLARADAALYRAKQMGRNQVCCEMSPSRRKG